MGAERRRNVSKIQTTYLKQQEYAEIASARKKKLLIRRLSLFFVLASVISYLMISSVLSQSAKIEAKTAEKQKLEQKLSQLKKKESILKEDIVKLHDKDYIGKLARKEYFFSEKNEIIFNIPEEDKEK
ncbi:septum formation initiator family protein [Neobacillus sp. OS1-32]|jgi:cell division protein DivIC|uniref:Septum formation initiator family protein n=1 Tax=Neobacillus paridis TaxID=2803862 RepID=A0ABS1TSF6_9BACI|nr:MULTISPECIES: septum formation initiator family protein [Neobacillus]MBL4954197.1 septum formation initiator family protein [Neobacillus paridis]WML29474.1 septum formation initiator family protein [Neobacillus sp. OS1-32]